MNVVGHQNEAPDQPTVAFWSRGELVSHHFHRGGVREQGPTSGDATGDEVNRRVDPDMIEPAQMSADGRRLRHRATLPEFAGFVVVARAAIWRSRLQ